MLDWASRFDIFCFLDNAQYAIEPHGFEVILAAGESTALSSDNLKDIDHFIAQSHKAVFGHLSYELKRILHQMPSGKVDSIGFPLFYFFNPQYLLSIQDNQLVIEAEEPDLIYMEIMEQQSIKRVLSSTPIAIRQRLTREDYLDKIKSLQDHIVRGDCYEINFCQEFYAENVIIDPIEAFLRLITISPNPFSCLYKLNEHVLICASPERFLTGKGNKLISQPIKGTIKRDLSDGKADQKLKDELQHSAKDQSENVMVVDMVRNDLSKVCINGSVHVDELFGIYSYPQVHQMISTISGIKRPGTTFSEIIEATFPMGSMTGAPKHRVMELIEEYETTARGIFSGSVGYINSNGDFDFNVVIRSIMYNIKDQYLSYQVGSGITFYSDPEKEWDECLLKAKAIRQVLESGGF